MKTTIRRWCVVVFVLGGVATGCGTGSPEGFFKQSTRLSCKYAKECQEAQWNLAGYDNVGECVDDLAKEDLVEAFADACGDFDGGAARKCLAGARKVKRECDLEAASSEQEDACRDVCENTQGAGDLVLDPGDFELAQRMAERLLARSEAQEPSDEQSDEPSVESYGELALP